MEDFRVPADTTAFIGAPASPLPIALTNRIRTVVEAAVGVREAHLPQCYIPGIIDPSAQVLVVVVDPAQESEVVAEIGDALRQFLPPELNLVVWPLPPRHALLRAVQDAGCKIAGPPTAKPRPWWQFWV